MKLVPCVCDACGKGGTCSESEPAPHGWFYVAIGSETALACSAKCKALPWKRHRRTS